MIIVDQWTNLFKIKCIWKSIDYKKSLEIRMGNQMPNIEEQTEQVQKDKQRSTKHTQDISENVVNLQYIQNKCSHSTCLVETMVNMAKQE